MSSLVHSIAKFGRWLFIKRNFYVYSVVAFGIPAWVLMSWFLWDYRTGVSWDLFLLLLCLLGSLAWAYAMWHLFVSAYAKSARSRDAKPVRQEEE